MPSPACCFGQTGVRSAPLWVAGCGSLRGFTLLLTLHTGNHVLQFASSTEVGVHGVSAIRSLWCVSGRGPRGLFEEEF
ncbi:hypothetical protein MHAE_09720 [Mycobacterium haemophilum DSM 44634]|uniref:Uncharacterized protein n=1 Tax=Mycobacterium haemophilum TaxID=29311 RepID=A0A0I9TXV1_9MYCO|nr:hypothetical protein ABH39_18030 [Mycobacterium haemophilum]KLO34586.1 hypothetical protein ABH38_18490 [Mycobacterium haemophilum]KLO40896.1 hypothetical protein ABH37_14685 [Mycobacterium haemophilum]KLO46509.1 hypothetical protein ABH36_18125 [Mycobacterium haemophilum]